MMLTLSSEDTWRQVKDFTVDTWLEIDTVY